MLTFLTFLTFLASLLTCHELAPEHPKLTVVLAIPFCHIQTFLPCSVRSLMLIVKCITSRIVFEIGQFDQKVCFFTVWPYDCPTEKEIEVLTLGALLVQSCIQKLSVGHKSTLTF
jgi:hypothetical protein